MYIRWLFLDNFRLTKKQIIYLKSAKIGDSNGALFIHKYIKLKQFKIFFFHYILSITIIFCFFLVRIKCSCIPTHRHQNFYKQYIFKGMREDPKIRRYGFWTDYNFCRDTSLRTCKRSALSR